MTHRWGSWTAPAAVALVTTLLALALARAFALGPVDDAYISLRYASNWAEGRGLCFNPGERVEGYTNFSWVALEAAAVAFGVEPVSAMRSLGWISLAALSVVLFLLMRWHVLPGRPILSAVLAVAGTTQLSLVCWAASGMESCLYAAVLLAALLASLSATSARRVSGTAALLVVAGMTRPEATVFVVPLCAIVYLRGRRVREAFGVAGAFVAVYGLYFAVRWAYFGSFLPNTFYAKLDYGSLALIERGARYVGRFLGAAWPLTLASGASLLLVRSWPLWVRGVLLVVATHAVVVVVEGGDHFSMFRFMTPLPPLMSALAVYAVARLVASQWTGRRPGMAVALVALASIVSSSLTMGWARSADGSGRSEIQRFVYEVDLARDWATIGRWLGEVAPPGSSLATIAVGAVGFESGLTIVDPHGIVDPEIARLDVRLGSGYPGHEKFDVAHVLSKRPSYFMIQNWLDPDPVPESALPQLVWGEFSRAVLRDPVFRSSYRYQIVRPLPGQLIGLHVRRDLAPPSGPPLARTSEGVGRR